MSLRPIEAESRQLYQATFHAEPEIIASAPGRVNLIGEHTDYTGGFVLPCAIDRRIAVALGSPSEEARDGRAYAADLDDLRLLAAAATGRDGSWVDYLRGVTWSLTRAGLTLPVVDAAVAGDVPQGAGLSS